MVKHRSLAEEPHCAIRTRTPQRITPSNTSASDCERISRAIFRNDDKANGYGGKGYERAGWMGLSIVIRAVTVLQEPYRTSERWVCRVIGQHRSTQRRPAKVAWIEEGKLRYRFREIASEHIRWGRWMTDRLLRRERWSVNHERLQRVLREEGLQRPMSRKRKLAGPTDNSMRRHRAENPHQV